jgi:hypothetical protein
LSWCDKLAATATVGFGVSHHFESIAAVLDALTPLLDKWVEGDRPLFTVERREPFSVTVSTEDGFNYEIDASRIAVGFQHSMHLSDGRPSANHSHSHCESFEGQPGVAGRIASLPAIS